MHKHCFPLSTKHSTVVQLLMFVSPVNPFAILPHFVHPPPSRLHLPREEYIPASGAQAPHHLDRVIVELHIPNISGHHVLPLTVVLHQIQKGKHPPFVWTHVPAVV
ncbi:hypothetical protein Pelo_3241 [Pelomyxa schiedti]|nr:hypothetical protein Pelo_3241 [Pelomyxa schiedti]